MLNRPDHTRNPRGSSATRPRTGRRLVRDNILILLRNTFHCSTCCYMDTLSPHGQTCPCTELDFLSLTTGRKKDSSEKVRVRDLQEKAPPPLPPCDCAPHRCTTTQPLMSYFRVAVGFLSYQNKLSLFVHRLANQRYFHMKVCAPGVVLKQR